MVNWHFLGPRRIQKLPYRGELKFSKEEGVSPRFLSAVGFGVGLGCGCPNTYS